MDETVLKIAIVALQVLWGLFLVVLSFAIRRVLRDLEENTKATAAVKDSLSQLNLGLLTNFVAKEDWAYIRQRVHDLGDVVQGIRAREELREQLRDKGP